MHIERWVAVTLLGATLATSASAGTTLHGPTPYLSSADSPFAGLSGLMIEDFEDGVLNLTGVSASVGGVVGPGSATDSVDADDGVIDGSGLGGHSLFWGSGATGILFTFDELILEGLPRHAGIVWTDGAGTIEFEAFDASGASIGTLSGTHAGGGHNGQTDEDRFYGISHDAGIGSIFIRNTAGGIEVDHLQFAMVPSPMTGMVLISGGLIGLGRRRRS